SMKVSAFASGRGIVLTRVDRVRGIYAPPRPDASPTLQSWGVRRGATLLPRRTPHAPRLELLFLEGVGEEAKCGLGVGGGEGGGRAAEFAALIGVGVQAGGAGGGGQPFVSGGQVAHRRDGLDVALHRPQRLLALAPRGRHQGGGGAGRA